MVTVVAFLVVIVKTELSSSGMTERVEYLSQIADGEIIVALTASVTVTVQVRVGLPASATSEYDASISTCRGSRSDKSDIKAHTHYKCP